MKSIYRKLLSGMLLLFLVVGIYNSVTFLLTGSVGSIFKSPEKTILIMGTDNAGLRTDVMMLGFVNGKKGRIDVVSIPRDTQVKIGSRIYKINSAYAIGKEEQAIETVENLLDVEIDGYVKFSFDTFRDAIDAMGGVIFDVPQDMFYEDPYQDLYIDLKEGKQHLDGKQAEGLVRFRRYPTGDEGRIAVQQEFIKAIIKQKANPAILISLPAMISVFEQNIDTNLNQKDIIEIAGVAVRAGGDKFNTYQLPGSAQYQSGVSYYIYNSGESAALIEQIKEGTVEAE